jgi:quinoprotein glucose dehydrogenase
MHIVRFWILAGAATALCSAALGQSPDAGWPFYGCNAGGERFAGLRQINETNVTHLKLAWTYRTGELKTYEGTGAAEKAAFEATPYYDRWSVVFQHPK